jgi:hypothetical protein
MCPVHCLQLRGTPVAFGGLNLLLEHLLAVCYGLRLGVDSRRARSRSIPRTVPLSLLFHGKSSMLSNAIPDSGGSVPRVGDAAAQRHECVDRLRRRMDLSFRVQFAPIEERWRILLRI